MALIDLLKRRPRKFSHPTARGFDPAYFEQLASLENGHFWFRARNRLLIWALRRHFAKMESFFEIGCGTGFVLAGVEKEFPAAKLFGSELYAEGLPFAGRRLKKAGLFQMDARSIPFVEHFDVIGAFDVLEHIEEDEQVLGEMHKAVKRGGGIVLSVPQHRFLWSQFDRHSHHVRRYSAKELRQKVEKAGFRVVTMTSFMTVSLPLLMAQRMQKPRKDYDVLSKLEVAPLANAVLDAALTFERALIKTGLRLPAGGSLFLVAVKDR